MDESITSEVHTSEDVVKPIPLAQRKFIANFLGRAQGKVGRLQLIELAERFPHEVRDFDSSNKINMLHKYICRLMFDILVSAVGISKACF